MHDIDISPSTSVRHKDGGAYSIVSITTVGDTRRAHINRAGFGTVFEGTVPQARLAGFMFGDEGKPGAIADGTIITHSAYPDRTYGWQPTGAIAGGVPVYRIMRDGVAVTEGTVNSLKESGFQFNEPDTTVADIEALLDPEPETWQQKDERIEALTAQVTAYRTTMDEMEERIATLNEEARARETTFTDLRRRVTVAERDLSSFKEQVVEAVKGARKEHDLCIDGCNSFLEGLNLPTISKTWKGTVTRDSDGETILTVTGIEADDEYAAKSELESNFNVTATVNKITYAYDYVGEGEADWDEEEWEDREDEDDDSYADTHKDALTFSVEEE